jgi:AAHS family 4-hydroxybenzoate transporter-like MFS transporter
MELAVGRLGAILGPFIGGALQQVFGGSGAMLAAIAVAAAGAAACVMFATKSEIEDERRQDAAAKPIAGAAQG